MIKLIKKIIKKPIKILFPFLVRKYHEIGEIRNEVDNIEREIWNVRREAGEIKQEVGEIKREAGEIKREAGEIKREAGEIRREAGEIRTALNLLTDVDFQFFKLRNMLNKIEYYQPAYMIGGINLSPKREVKDRCRSIEKSLNGKVAGLKILDIGSSLGYVCYYFADRGAVTEGWESNTDNAEAARLIGRINGIPASIKTKEADKESINEIQPREYDVAIILSVLHHIIHFKGLEYVQELVKELFNKVSTLIVELACKGEDTELFWNDAQPEDSLDVFDLIKDEANIEKIGDFHTHLSKKTRPLYKISQRDKNIFINGKLYSYDKKTNWAYENSEFSYNHPRLRRYYYFSHTYIIKEYIFNEKNDDNVEQIILEIGNMFFLQRINKVKTTKLIDFEIKDKNAFVIIARDDGELLSDIWDKKEIDPEKIAEDVLEFLSVLEESNYHHNDIRSWNILWDGRHTQVIDYGLMSPIIIDDDIVSLLWVLDAILTECKEGSLHGNKPLPPKSHFIIPRLQRLYEIVEEGERSPKKLLDFFLNFGDNTNESI